MHDVFLSPAKANTFWYLKGEITDQISPKTWKYWECMGNPVKAWEIPGRLGISWESIGNPGIAWKILGKHGKSRENTGNLGEISQEKLLKPGKSRAFFLVIYETIGLSDKHKWAKWRHVELDLFTCSGKSRLLAVDLKRVTAHVWLLVGCPSMLNWTVPLW